MNKKWTAPEIEVLNVDQTAGGWNAWKWDGSWDGLPLVGGSDNDPDAPSAS